MKHECMKSFRRMVMTIVTLTAVGSSVLADDKDWANLGCYAQQNEEVIKWPQQQRRVVFMGNSITQKWASMRPQFFEQNGYVGRGISGQTSYQFVVRFRQDVIDLKPELVVINTGTNDVAENTGPYNEDRTFTNIETMVDLALVNNIKVILTSILPAAKFRWRPGITDGAAKIEKLNARIRDYAAKKNIPFVDYYSKMVKGENRALNPAYSKDGVHPTEAGYAVMEPIVKAAIDKALGLDIKDRHLKSFAESIAAPADNIRVSRRPIREVRLFYSDTIEKKIEEVQKLLKDAPYLAWMFGNCFPNTLDTTVHYSVDDNGDDDTFVYTGDIHAMWLRDSGAQVWPYVQFAKHDEKIRKMVRGTILRQLKCIVLDPYANAFNFGPTGSAWASDHTDMKPFLHERKYEIDSLCYPIRLAYQYWLTSGDDSIFKTDLWRNAVLAVLKTFRDQQRKENHGVYHFQRTTAQQYDTMSHGGYGNPVKPVGLIASAFRPSDDATVLLYLVPSNFFAVMSLRKAADILMKVNDNRQLAAECTTLADEVEAALREYAVYDHPKYGKIYSFEVDGFGNHLLMDDANVPSLLAMAYLGDVDVNDPIYQNTRRFVWSEDNPYFFRGRAGEGIGGPHVGYDMVWPMSIMMRAFTSTDDREIQKCIQMLVDTDAGTGFMHESFHKDDASNYSRPWFAWQNTLFGELILKLIDDGKLNVLNKIQKH